MEKQHSELYLRVKKLFEEDLKRAGVNMTYEQWLERDLQGWKWIGLGNYVKYRKV